MTLEDTQLDLLTAKALFEEAFEHAPVGMAVTRPLPSGRSEVLRCNNAYARMVGYEAADLVGRDSTDLMHPDDGTTRERMLADLLAGRPTTGEFRLRHREGHYVWVLLAPAMVTAPDGEALFVMHAVDITDRKRFEGRLKHIADHDLLTGLLSRRRFEHELEREAARARRSGLRSCLLLLDLDGFKYVNDTLGHPEGDRLLTRIADALAEHLREVDVLARIGGDEFAVILPDTDAPTGQIVADRLLDIVRENGRVVREGRHADVTASVGLAVLTGAPTQDAEELLVEADIAMYQAKEAGRDQVALASPHEREALTRRADWVGRMRAAIAEDRLVPHAQPILPIAALPESRERFELLVRMRDADGEIIAPATFLPHAERHGMIVDLDRWMLRHAVTELHRAALAGRSLSLGVNFSAVTLQDPRIGCELAELLDAMPIGENKLVVEVTETSAITNVTRAGELARQLRTLGCGLALDDFGAGFASLASIKTLVFDSLKIDGSFIEGLPGSPTDQLVVKAVVDIARGLGVSVVAERVGDPATVALLRDLGVDYGQGYFLGAPGPLPRQ